MNLTFAQAAKGVNKEVTLNVVDTCPKCRGSRCEPGHKAVKCPYCNGTGMETVGRASFFGFQVRKTKERNEWTAGKGKRDGFPIFGSRPRCWGRDPLNVFNRS